MDQQQDRTVNVLLATFAGLGLPRTLSLPTKASATVGNVYETIYSRLPASADSLLITTVSNKQLLPSDDRPISTLLSSPSDTLLSLRLSRRLCGGKGGFGSQLRAAGGRMSSRKNRANQSQNVNGSNRNLDGRRLRTVDEAKRLAEYLAIKPEMEKKEKAERKKRWEAVVEAAERREDEIKAGKGGANKGRLDAEYVESKELAEEKTREAVMKAMRESMLERTGSESSVEEEGDSEDEEGDESSGSSDNAKAEAPNAAGSRSFFGWDEEDDDSEDDEEEKVQAPQTYEGKGKGKA